MAFVVEGRKDMDFDLTDDFSVNLRNMAVVIISSELKISSFFNLVNLREIQHIHIIFYMIVGINYQGRRSI